MQRNGWFAWQSLSLAFPHATPHVHRAQAPDGRLKPSVFSFTSVDWRRGRAYCMPPCTFLQIEEEGISACRRGETNGDSLSCFFAGLSVCAKFFALDRCRFSRFSSAPTTLAKQTRRHLLLEAARSAPHAFLILKLHGSAAAQVASLRRSHLAFECSGPEELLSSACRKSQWLGIANCCLSKSETRVHTWLKWLIHPILHFNNQLFEKQQI